MSSPSRIRKTTVAVIAAVALSIVAAVYGSTAGAKNNSGATIASSTTNKLGLITPGTLTVATLNDQPPTDSLNSAGQPVGFSVALLRKIATDLHLKVTFVLATGPGLLQGVGTGRYDTETAPLGVTAARKQTMSFSIGWDWAPDQVISMKSKPVKTMAQAASSGAEIGVLGSSQQETTLQTEFPKVQIKAFPSQTAEITALKAGQIDGVFLGGADAAAVAPTSKDFYRGATVQIPTPDATAVRKGHTALLDAINSQLHTLIKDGTFMKLWNQYVPFAPASQALKAYPAMRKGLAKHYRESMT